MCPQRIKCTHGQQRTDEDQRQQHQSRDVLGHQHAVVDLHKIERRAQIKQIDDTAEDASHREMRQLGADRLAQFVIGLALGGHEISRVKGGVPKNPANL